MIKDINITVYDDKRLKADNHSLGNKLDNGITRLVLNIDNCELVKNLNYKYLALKNASQNNFYLVDVSEDLNLLITDFYTKRTGQWEILVIASNSQIVEGDIENDMTNFVSDTVKLTVTDNFLDNDFEIRTNEEVM